MAARAGHDLKIAVTDWRGALTTPAADGGGGGSLELTIHARSLRVREGTGGVKALTDSDRSDIEKTINEKVLATGRHPEITFTSTAITATGPDRWDVEGQLTLAGVTRSIAFPVTVETAADGRELHARATIVQSEYGIKPYSAMMGALKVADPVEVSARVRLP
jgi:polyisoprenoid-binding protein YceI